VWGSADARLVNNVFRWYEPSTGRYTKPDPLGLGIVDIHPYAYVSNRSVIYVDTHGLRGRLPSVPHTVPPQPSPLECKPPRSAATARSSGVGLLGRVSFFLGGLFSPSPANTPTLDDIFGRRPNNCSACNDDRRDIRKMCVRLYGQCYDYMGHHKFSPGWTCDKCMQRCIAQDGEWPYQECQLWARGAN